MYCRRIQACFAASIERFLKVGPFLFGEGPDDCRPVRPGIPAALTQPLLFFPIPAFNDLAGDGIVSSKCDEDHGPRLRPVRTTMLVDAQFGFGIEAFAEHVTVSSGLFVSFRSAKALSFAERKATLVERPSRTTVS